MRFVLLGLLSVLSLWTISSCARVSTINGCPIQANARCPGVDLSNQKYVFVNADLSNVNFAGAILSGSDFSGANLTGADLRGATLTGTKFAKANLSQVKIDDTTFDSSDLTNAKFVNTVIKNVKFDKAILVQTDFTGAKISCSSFSDQNSFASLNLTNATLLGTRFDQDTSAFIETDAVKCYVSVLGNVQSGDAANCQGALWTEALACTPSICTAITAQARCDDASLVTNLANSACKWDAATSACIALIN